MEKSQENPLIYEAIANVMKDIDAVPKDRKNAQQGYAYRGIDEMYNSLNPIFSRHKVFCTSEIVNSIREERITKAGGLMIYAILDVKFTFYTVDGSSVSSVMRGEANDTSDKASNKAMSVAYKYALMQLLMIPTKEDKDIEAHTNEATKKQAVAPVKAPAKIETLLATSQQKDVITRLLESPCFTDERRQKAFEKINQIDSKVAEKMIVALAKDVINHYIVDDAIVTEDERTRIKGSIDTMAMKDLLLLAKDLKTEATKNK